MPQPCEQGRAGSRICMRALCCGKHAESFYGMPTRAISVSLVPKEPQSNHTKVRKVQQCAVQREGQVTTPPRFPAVSILAEAVKRS